MNINKQKQEYLINTLLLFIKREMEEKGVCVGMENYIYGYCFNAEFEHHYSLFSEKPTPDSEDIKKLKQICDFTKDELQIILNYCVANEYLKKDFNKYALMRKGKTKADKYEKYLKEHIENNDLIFNQEILNIDDKLSKIIQKARTLYLNREIQSAVEKIWDALERTKTILNSDKKKGVYGICSICEANIAARYINDEFNTLTKIGNEYQIRHFETDKKEITDEEILSYLFFRAYSLIIFSINKIYKNKQIN